MKPTRPKEHRGPTPQQKEAAKAAARVGVAAILSEHGQTKQIGLGGINVPPERLRALRPAVVKELAESMKARGQLQAIVVRPRGQNGYWLIAGRHRYEAARKLKWPKIRATILEGVKADAAELMEIDENLIRADLTAAERAMHVARRKELYEAAHPETKHGGDRRSKKSSGQVGHLRGDRFTKETAKATGQSERKVRRDAARGNNVKVLADVVGTSLDKGNEIDALAQLPESEQRKLAERAKAGEKVSAAATKGRRVGNSADPQASADQRKAEAEEAFREDTPEERWQRSLGHLAGQLVALEAFWDREFGDWREFAVTRDLAKLAREASGSWSAIVHRVELQQRPDHHANGGVHQTNGEGRQDA
jgi:ParB-like chromosome segregation protein Spo0J